MTMKRCVGCETMVIASARQCPKCGRPMKVQKRGGGNTGVAVAVSIGAVLVLLLAVLVLANRSKEEPRNTVAQRQPKAPAKPDVPRLKDAVAGQYWVITEKTDVPMWSGGDARKTVGSVGLDDVVLVRKLTDTEVLVEAYEEDKRRVKAEGYIEGRIRAKKAPAEMTAEYTEAREFTLQYPLDTFQGALKSRWVLEDEVIHLFTQPVPPTQYRDTQYRKEPLASGVVVFVMSEDSTDRLWKKCAVMDNDGKSYSVRGWINSDLVKSARRDK